jgi:hypothetical protein
VTCACAACLGGWFCVCLVSTDRVQAMWAVAAVAAAHLAGSQPEPRKFPQHVGVVCPSRA